MFKLFREYQQGEKVVIGADPADGGSDYCAAHGVSMKRNDVPMVFHARMESSQFGHELYKMAKYIHKFTGEWPLIAVERNVGMGTILVLTQYNYPKLFRMPKIDGFDGESDKIGWVTSTATRPMMIDSLALSLKQGALRIYDIETVKELMSFIRNQKGKPEAAYGSYDDLVMSLAIANQVIQISPKNVSSGEDRLAKISQFQHQELFDDTGVSNV